MAVTNDPNEAVLAAGLRWLYDTEQPSGALLIHHGERMAGEANRTFSFVPVGWYDNAIIVVEVAHIEWMIDDDHDTVPANPLEPNELDRLSVALTALGAEVTRTWNGHPATTGSLALKRPSHPSLLAAVRRYSAGCQTHPDKGVFCGCGWYRQGYANIIRPTLTEV